MESASDQADEALERAALIKPLLAGLGGQIQGAILVELVSLWLAGNHPELREEHWQNFTDAVLALVPIQEKEILAHFPGGWGREH